MSTVVCFHAHPGQDTDDVLVDWLGMDDSGVAALRDSGAVA